MPSVLFDAVVVPGGAVGVNALKMAGQCLEFIRDQYRHCKPMLVLDEGVQLLEAAGIAPNLPDGQPDPGLLVSHASDIAAATKLYIDSIAAHRHFARAAQPPRV